MATVNLASDGYCLDIAVLVYAQLMLWQWLGILCSCKTFLTPTLWVHNLLRCSLTEPVHVSVATQSYRVDVGVAQVIRGNEVIIKCDIPSFAADFVSVSDWVDSEGISYQPSSSLGKIFWFWIQHRSYLKKAQGVHFTYSSYASVFNSDNLHKMGSSLILKLCANNMRCE